MTRIVQVTLARRRLADETVSRTSGDGESLPNDTQGSQGAKSKLLRPPNPCMGPRPDRHFPGTETLASSDSPVRISNKRVTSVPGATGVASARVGNFRQRGHWRRHSAPTFFLEMPGYVRQAASSVASGELRQASLSRSRVGALRQGCLDQCLVVSWRVRPLSELRTSRPRPKTRNHPARGYLDALVQSNRASRLGIRLHGKAPA